MSEKKRNLVLGGEGFVGKHLCEYLRGLEQEEKCEKANGYNYCKGCGGKNITVKRKKDG
jgi:hypothetical protein